MKLQVRHILIPFVCLMLVTFVFHFRSLRANEVPNAQTATLHGDPAHPATASNWVDTRLYFGLGPADAPDKGVPDAAWRDFLDHEVTPRFPSGLSVIDVYGQWQGKQQKSPERVRTKLLIIDYPDTRDNRDRIEAIRLAWKKRTGDQSVLKVTEPADISF
jgi:hypothetical protein